MNINTFIHRPLFSMVISVIIVLLGVISLLSLPVERYPDIAPPAIYVWASYPGASAETVQKSVVMPLEEAINGVEGMTYMTSSASNGSASITIYFEQGANADMAAVNVQNRVIQAQAQLLVEIEKTLPKDIKFVTFDNTNDFLFASIREVILTLIIGVYGRHHRHLLQAVRLDDGGGSGNIAHQRADAVTCVVCLDAPSGYHRRQRRYALSAQSI